MVTNPAGAQAPEPKNQPTPRGPRLTISDLARRTGLTPATLRTWETRHGFPRPTRLGSGHRRYDEHDVALVERVLRRRDAGVRLEVAIREAAADPAPAGSVFAVLRSRHPHLAAQPLRKSTLLALTRAMEDECCARAQRPVLYGAFQHARFFGQSMSRWTELARTAHRTTVFADLHPEVRAPGMRLVHLPADALLRREWVLVCDAPDYPACLAAWELPGQDDVQDADRLFESVWALDPRAVRDAARACARLADRLDPAGASDPTLEPDEPPPAPSADLARASTLLRRMVGYVDRLAR